MSRFPQSGPRTRVCLPDGRHAFDVSTTQKAFKDALQASSLHTVKTLDGSQPDTVQLAQAEFEKAERRYADENGHKQSSELWKEAAREYSDPSALPPNTIRQCELDWIKSKVRLVLSEELLRRDLFAADAEAVLAAVAAFRAAHADLAAAFGEGESCVFGALAWHGVSTRWKAFMEFLEALAAKPEEFPMSSEEALRRFANHLGRVIGYRALALTKEQYNTIIELNEIVSTGGLSASQQQIDAIVAREGVGKIAAARLFISMLRKWIGLDPSLSLHDDKETTLTISLTYMMENQGKTVYLFEMDVPKIHCMGWHIQYIEKLAHIVDPKFIDAKRMRWFEHNSVWFDTWDERTERQLLYSIPFLRERCRSIKEYKTAEEIVKECEPFKHKQFAAMQASQQESA